MQLKALVCPCTLNDALGANSSAARPITSSFDSLFVLSQVPSVSPLKSKPAWALSLQVGMKTDRIRTDITDITFVFIFLSGFGFEYG